jgi:hypothetical protein
MVEVVYPSDLAPVQDLLDAQDYETAQDRIEGLRGTVGPDDAPYLELLEIQLSLAKSEVAPGLALARLVAVMRDNPSIGGLKDLYQHISSLMYSSGQSSLAHSHPPPPIAMKK